MQGSALSAATTALFFTQARSSRVARGPVALARRGVVSAAQACPVCRGGTDRDCSPSTLQAVLATAATDGSGTIFRNGFEWPWRRGVAHA